MVFKTKGTCSSQISFDIVDGKLHNVIFTDFCTGYRCRSLFVVHVNKYEDRFK